MVKGIRKEIVRYILGKSGEAPEGDRVTLQTQLRRGYMKSNKIHKYICTIYNVYYKKLKRS